MIESIRLIVGLGNPGPKYETTRHNAGFWLADLIADDFHADFKLENNFFGEVAKFRHGGENVYLLKPATYMNLSGKSVQALSHFYKIPLESILVLHDELDLMPGQVKLKKVAVMQVIMVCVIFKTKWVAVTTGVYGSVLAILVT